MPTATAEKVTFLSKSPNLRVVFKAKREDILRNQSGIVVGIKKLPDEELIPQEWLRVALEDGLEVDVDALPSGANFKNWKFETDDENVIAALRAHPNNGKELAGFTERFASAEERLTEVTKLIAAQDVDGLRSLYETEQRQGNHANVLEAIVSALDVLDTDAEPEGKAEGEPVEAGSTDDSAEPNDGPPDGED